MTETNSMFSLKPHPYKQPILTIRDESKFGTVIGDEKIVKAQQIVKNGDRVKFGTVSSIYRFVHLLLLKLRRAYSVEELCIFLK